MHSSALPQCRRLSRQVISHCSIESREVWERMSRQETNKMSYCLDKSPNLCDKLSTNATIKALLETTDFQQMTI